MILLLRIQTRGNFRNITRRSFRTDKIGSFRMSKEEFAEASRSEVGKHWSELSSEEKEARKRRIEIEKCQKRKKKKEEKFSQNKLWKEGEFAKYIVDENAKLRYVVPHTFEFRCFAKERWFGRKLLEVLADEYMAFPSEYYAKAIEIGRITVNDAKVDADYQIKNQDVIKHTTHRHEPSVTSENIQVIYNDDKFVDVKDSGLSSVLADPSAIVVTSKPSSVPIHPCGKYYFNSMVFILAKESQLHLHPVHRLDRLTSGLTIFAKNSAVAAEISKQIRERNVEKYYLARVKGFFNPSESDFKTSTDSLTFFQSESIQQLADEFGKSSKEIIVEERMGALNPRQGLHGLTEEHDMSDQESTGLESQSDIRWKKRKSKHSKSVFRLVSYDSASDTSVVLCRPYTGRTHQLRVHLQHTGFPIANDPNYGGKSCMGNTRSPETACGIGYFRDKPHVRDEILCWDCDYEKSREVANSKPQALYCYEIWLHALRYAFQDPGTKSQSVSPHWSFQVPPPKWAFKEFQVGRYLDDVNF